MKQSQHFLENAENCARMAERPTSPAISATSAWRPPGEPLRPSRTGWMDKRHRSGSRPADRNEIRRPCKAAFDADWPTRLPVSGATSVYRLEVVGSACR